jgi:DNA-directed RNA polymerase III subunit RPC1
MLIDNSKHIQFQPLTPKEIVRISEVEVVTSDLYMNTDGKRTTAKDGVLDGRMVGWAVAGV